MLTRTQGSRSRTRSRTRTRTKYLGTRTEIKNF